VTQVGDRIWLVSFMQYDLGYFDDETSRLEPIENSFGRKVSPILEVIRLIDDRVLRFSREDILRARKKGVVT